MQTRGTCEKPRAFGEPRRHMRIALRTNDSEARGNNNANGVGRAPLETANRGVCSYCAGGYSLVQSRGHPAFETAWQE